MMRKETFLCDDLLLLDFEVSKVDDNNDTEDTATSSPMTFDQYDPSVDYKTDDKELEELLSDASQDDMRSQLCRFLPTRTTADLQS